MYYHLVRLYKELGGSSGKMMSFQKKQYTEEEKKAVG